jgi:hypothetical protein
MRSYAIRRSNGAPTTINCDVLVLTEEARAKLMQANRERIMALPEGFIEGEFTQVGQPPTPVVRVADESDTPETQ